MKILFVILLMLFPLTAQCAWDDVKETLSEVSDATDYPIEDLVAVTYLESSFRPEVRAAKGTATGLMQITRPTWNHLVKKYGKENGVTLAHSRTDSRANTLMGIAYIRENEEILENSLGRKVTLFETYMAYKFGPQRAIRFLRTSNNTPLVIFYPGAAKNNSAVYYHKDGSFKTVGDVKSMFKWRISNALRLFKAKALLAQQQYLMLNEALYAGTCTKTELTLDDVRYMAHEEMENPVTYAQVNFDDAYTDNVYIHYYNNYDLMPASGRRYNDFLI